MLSYKVRFTTVLVLVYEVKSERFSCNLQLHYCITNKGSPDLVPRTTPLHTAKCKPILPFTDYTNPNTGQHVCDCCEVCVPLVHIAVLYLWSKYNISNTCRKAPLLTPEAGSVYLWPLTENSVGHANKKRQGRLNLYCKHLLEIDG